jgi:hypothetical protein
MTVHASTAAETATETVSPLASLRLMLPTSADVIEAGVALSVALFLTVSLNFLF